MRNQETVRRHNLSTLLRRLHLDGPLSRSQLTTSMALNRSTIADLVGELEELGLVRQQLPNAGERAAAGRPSVGVTTTARACVLAVDIRVSEVRVALIGLAGAVLATARADVPSDRDPQATVATVHQLSGAILRGAGQSALVGVGVAVPGIVARDCGTVRLAPNLNWRDVPLADMLAEALDLGMRPVLGNEADHGALAEHLRGVGRNVDELVYLSGEVGVGAGLIAGGRPVTGMSGFAGEVGHLPFGSGMRTCHCGAVGCWETEIGAAAMADAVGCPSDRLAEVGDYLDRLDAAPAELVAVGRRLGHGLAGVVNLLNPELIVLGGFLRPLYRWVERDVREEMSSRALRIPGMAPRIVLPGLGDRSVLIGASEVAFRALLDDPVGCLSASVR
ncbi:ROK family protein [Mycobacterium sp. WMMD1722]|uniref:ROK family protein n=1 Tax=Mycobacterium sp. WMMD1722 TaxID=3404117 RepID=UPI003BF51160